MAFFRDTLFILSVCGVTMLNIFVHGALIIALPSLGRALQFKESELQWPLNVYALSQGSLLLLFGRIADVVGSKKMSLFGAGFVAVWSFATALSPNKVALIIFVALTGVGAAANTPTGISIFVSHFESGSATKNKAIAALGAGQSIGYVVGPIGGGILCQKVSLWRVIFYIQGGLAATFFVLGVLTIPPDPARARYTKGIDWIGACLSVSGFGLLTFVLSESTTVSRGWRTPWAPALLVVSLVVLLLFVAWEAHRERADRSVLMPVSILMKRGTKMAPMVGTIFLAWGGYNVTNYFVALYFDQVQGLDPLRTSLEILPSVIAVLAANAITGWLLSRVRGDVLIAGRFLISMAAPLALTLLDVHASYWASGFLVMVFVSWTDVAYTVGKLQISIAFGADSQGLAGGIFNVATRLGTSLALALSSSIATAVSDAYAARHPTVPGSAPAVLERGFRAAGWFAFALAAASSGICVVFLRGAGVIGRLAPRVSDAIEKEGGGTENEMGDVFGGAGKMLKGGEVLSEKSNDGEPQENYTPS
ncbi:MFS general substrate transporter [Sparassis crispa]|uniref:MFS general substrate transporter n=1 Tax=Sparassis crispa TaxID=139825 RepID=A0A401GYN7_9APHY|nr:MFS general substrate transporter [Sparassis crispa]GBE87278.1 MFS general substrate transporter [Sparassis crispa]